MPGFPPNGRPQNGNLGRGASPARGGAFAASGRPVPAPGQLGDPLSAANILQTQLAAAGSPAAQKQILGENLFPKIQTLQPELAGKITGMLLEMDNNELVGLFEDDDALRAKVNEAMLVYEEYMKTQKEPEAGDKKEEKAEEKA